MSHSHSHHHEHHHEHGHQHVHTISNYGPAFIIGILLNISYIIIEIVFGLKAGSSALLADAGHNTGDVLSLVFSFAAIRLALWKPSGRYTYGLRRTTILVALLNTMMLFGAVGLIVYEAVEHLQHPVQVAGNTIIVIALIGIAVNTITALLFMKGQEHDLNVKAAFLHMASDALVSLGVVLAGILINLTGLVWIDSVTSFIIAAIILYGSWGLFADALKLALDAVPRGIEIAEVKDYLSSIKGVEQVHDLHIWAMSTTQTALTVHLVMTTESTDDNFLPRINKELREHFHISHSTIQIDKALSTDCEKC